MKKTNGMRKSLRVMAGVFALVAVLAMGLGMDAFSIVSLADSAGKITATSAKIRKEASTSSDTVGSVEQNAKVSVKGQIKGSDGYTWYQVAVDGGNGYIRSDLMEITDGSTPANIVAATTTTQQPAASTPTTSTPDETLVEVVEVEPVSANVSGTSPVRVRQNASTTSRIVSTAQGGLALTVTGTATGTDGKNWYRVNFIANGAEVTGFIRADYVKVNGDIVPAGSVPEATEPVEQETPVEESVAPAENKAWDTFYQNDVWHLVDNSNGNAYDINKIFETVEANNKTLKETLAANQTQQVVVIALVIAIVLLILVISVLFFKNKELKDAYEELVERSNRRRSAERPASRQEGERPVRQRPAEGERPVKKRPVEGERPVRQRPVEGERPVRQRPTEGERPVRQRPAEGERPVKQRPVEANMADAVQPVKEPVVEPVPEQAPAKPQDPGKRKARNFVDDDEFEFQFLDWDEDQE